MGESVNHLAAAAGLEAGGTGPWEIQAQGPGANQSAWADWNHGIGGTCINRWWDSQWTGPSPGAPISAPGFIDFGHQVPTPVRRRSCMMRPGGGVKPPSLSGTHAEQGGA